MNILAVIPARGGSKSIPRKNIRPFAGRPLIAHTIDHGLQSRLITRVIVSTDDREIADIAAANGAEVPFIRPAEFSQDDTPDWPVFNHALRWLREHEDYRPDWVVNLRPTTPNRRPETLDRAIEALASRPGFDSLRSVRPSEYSPYKMVLMDPDGRIRPVVRPPECDGELWNMPRQALPATYQGDGYIDISHPDVILESGAMFGPRTMGFVVSEPAVDIDTEEDLGQAESIHKAGSAR